MDIVIRDTGSLTSALTNRSLSIFQFVAGCAQVLHHARAQLSDLVTGLGRSQVQQLLGIRNDSTQISGQLFTSAVEVSVNSVMMFLLVGKMVADAEHRSASATKPQAHRMR